jgi:hypothetical protein
MKNMPKVMTTYLGVVAVLIDAPAMKIRNKEYEDALTRLQTGL